MQSVYRRVRNPAWPWDFRIEKGVRAIYRGVGKTLFPSFFSLWSHSAVRMIWGWDQWSRMSFVPQMKKSNKNHPCGSVLLSTDQTSTSDHVWMYVSMVYLAKHRNREHCTVRSVLLTLWSKHRSDSIVLLTICQHNNPIILHQQLNLVIDFS